MIVSRLVVFAMCTVLEILSSMFDGDALIEIALSLAHAVDVAVRHQRKQIQGFVLPPAGRMTKYALKTSFGRKRRSQSPLVIKHGGKWSS